MAKARSNGVWHRPVVSVDVPLDGDYAGRTVKMRRNPPLSVLDKLDDLEDVPAVRAAVASLILSHDLPDDDGNLLVLDASASQLTGQELWLIVGCYYKALRGVTELPKGVESGLDSGSPTASSPKA
jgi:hypothetical protein